MAAAQPIRNKHQVRETRGVLSSQLRPRNAWVIYSTSNQRSAKSALGGRIRL